MNSQTKTIRARRANIRQTPIGKHWTLTRVIDHPERGRFAFAEDDEGNPGFVPRPVVTRHQITEADVGAGFHAPFREPAAGAGGEAAPQIMFPIKFDGEAEEIEIEVPSEPERDYEGEIDTLIEKVEGFVKLSDIAGKMVTKAELMQKEAQAITRECENLKSVAAVLANEANDVEQWLNDEYGDEEKY